MIGDQINAFAESFRDNVLCAGQIEDEELPIWLGRLGPQAVLFADRRWSGADPRVTRWTNLATAHFDALRTDVFRSGDDLHLPAQASAQFAASAIAAWLIDITENAKKLSSGVLTVQ